MIPTQNFMNDYDKITYSCEQNMAILESNVVEWEYILFYDECNLIVNDKANRQNSCNLSGEDHHCGKVEHKQYAEKIMFLQELLPAIT